MSQNQLVKSSHCTPLPRLRGRDRVGVLAQLGMVLSLGLGLTLALLWLVGGAGIQIAQASLPARPLFAPAPTGTDPISNALNVPVTGNVSITFDEAISLTSVTSRTFALYGSQSPIFTGTYALSNLSRTVTLDPDRDFFPGEVMQAIVTTATLNITNEQAISATVWQFWAAVGGGTGVFADSGQSLGSANSRAVALGDVDGDGDLDAFVGNNGANTVWRNDGTGTFTDTGQSLSSAVSWAVALGDVDSDGDLDAFVGNGPGQANTVWRNDGTGSFSDSGQSLGSADSLAVILGDVDGDGDLDAFVGNNGANTVWRNDGTGTFTDSGQSLGITLSYAIALGDVDGDGDLDALVGNDGANTVWQNDGTGTFNNSGQSLGSADSRAVTLGDVDGDGDLDAFVGNDGINTVWRNDGTGTFNNSGQSLGSALSWAVALGDLDGDGDLDAFVGNNGANTVWRNDGTGTFGNSGQNLGSADSQAAALGDVDSDGDLDAFVGNYAVANTVWQNQDPTDLGIVKAGQPTSAAPGEMITYTLVFSNNGPGTATGVVITDIVPISLTNTSVVSVGVVITPVGGTRYVWNVADLAMGTGGVITITGILSTSLPDGHVFTNTAIITNTIVDPSLGNNSSFVTSTIVVPDLVITKTASPEPAVAGTSLVYTIVVANQSLVSAADVVLSDTLPASTTLQYVDQTDDDDDTLGFGGGTHGNTHWHDTRPGTAYDDWVELIDPALNPSGVFTSRVMDASNVGSWTTLDWTPRRPYWKPLPDGQGAEAAYALGDANMAGNRVLLHLDDAGPPFADASGLGNDGTCTNCPTTGANGRFNTALTFDGANDTVVISDTLDPARYALELWVYPTGTIADTSLILRTYSMSGTVAAYSHLLGISGGRFVHLVNDGSVRTITGTTAIVANTWYHVVGTAESGGDIKLYVNGAEEALLNGIGTLWTGGDEYVLGSAYGSVANTFSGRLDEVAVYSRTLSAAEVTDHYLRGALRLSFDVRSCDDAVCAGESFGGAYSEQTNAGLGLPSVTLSGVPDNRYFQYRAAFETDDVNYSPELRRVSVGPAHRAIYATQGNCVAPSASAFTCTLGTIAPGGMVTVTMQGNIDPSALGIITNTASMTTTSGDADPLDNDTFVTTTVTSLSDLRISKYDVDDPVNVGSVITYGLNVHNFGPSTALSVTVTDTLPSGLTGYASGTGWTCDSPGNTITCTIPVLSVGYHWSAIVVTATAPLAEEIVTNTAWTTSTVTPVYTTTNISDTELTFVTPLADLVIVKSANPDPVNPGETLTFTVTVTNTGPYTATNVTVTDTLPSGMTGYPFGSGWSCSAPGDVVNCDLSGPLTPTTSASFYITVTAPLSGLIANVATVTADEVDPDTDNNVVVAYAAVRPVADLSISKIDTPDPVDAAAPLTYTLTITNAGPVAAGALTTTLSLTNPDAIAIPWIGRAWRYPASIYLGSVPGTVRELTVTLNDLNHTYPGDLSILLVGPGGSSAVLMANAGGGTDVSGVTLTFNDAGVSLPVSGTITSTTVYRPTSYGLSGDFASPAPAGPYGGSLSVFNGGSPNGVWQLYVYDNVDSDGGNIAAGWNLQLTAVTTDTVTLTDTLPSGLTGVSVMAPPGWVCDTGSDPMTCVADRFEVNVPTVFTITASAPITGGIITNTAGITSTTADLEPGDNTVTITTTVTAAADLAITKTVNAPLIEPGAPITYTLVISNIGPSPLLNTVMVTDLLPADLTGVSASGTGWACDTSALPLVTCTVGSLAVGPAPDIVIVATTPITPGIITNTAGITSTGAAAIFDPDLLNNSAVVTTTVDEMPIAGLAAFNDSPTALGNPTNLWATVTAGSNVSYAWNFGDTLTASGNPVSHTYALTGTYTAVVTATNSRGFMTATTQVQVIEWYGLYLPLVMRNYAVAPDLVVDGVVATSNAVTVTIRNQGPAAVEDEFWVDVYINPDTPPTQVNQTWQYVGSQGLVWGVTAAALPIQPGDVLTLTVNDAYYWPTESAVTWPLSPGTPVYAQVDSAHAATAYGGVMEDHEIIGGAYNNIIGPVSSTGVAGAALPPVEDGSRPGSADSLPPR